MQKVNERRKVAMKKNLVDLFVVATFISSITFAQEPYKIPFASPGNTIELTIANTSSIIALHVKIEVTNNPPWVKFSQKEVTLNELKGNEEKAALFSFVIDKSAPINKAQTLAFTIRSQTGEGWTKSIKIQITPPENFELFQNYPNPFNPATTISYQLSVDSKVSLRIYDVLGREVATLVGAEQTAGYHQETWNAAPYSSGMYIYQLTYTDPQGHRQFHRKTMLLVK